MASLNPSDLFSVQGLVAVITGGGTGIGLMIAQALEANGAIVFILGRRQEVLDKAASTAKHSNIHTLKTDVTSKSDLEKAVAHVSEKIGYVNLVIANSGISGPKLEHAKGDSLQKFRDHLWSWDSDDFTQTYAVNNTAAFFTIVAFLDLLDKGNKKGNVTQTSQVIVTSSIGAYNRVPAAGFSYGSSKAAVTHMSKQLATLLVPYDIRVNVIAPGLFPSEMTQEAIGDKKSGDYPKDFIPVQRIGITEDMAGAALFLTSRSGGYINGNVVVIDGGRLSVVPASY